jgi:GT2 family glycosyltransferase
MAKLLQNDSVGGVMARTMSSSQIILYDYLRLNGLSQKWLIAENEVIETDYLAGSCLLLKRAVVEEVGLFNEKFFMYWEEVDLSIRMKNAGYKLISTTLTSIFRKENESIRSLNMTYYLVRNSILMSKLHKRISIIDVIIYLFQMLKFCIANTFKNKKLGYLNNFISGITSGILTRV